MGSSLMRAVSGFVGVFAPCIALLGGCEDDWDYVPFDPGPFCTPGETLVVGCGYNGRGEQLRVCSAEGRWHAGGDCEDPDECEDGYGQVAACEDGAFGMLEQTCNEGVWVSGDCRAHAISTSVTAEHTCAVRRNGRVICWGSNDALQLGNANYAPPHHEDSPVFVNGIDDAKSVAVGARHSCALHQDGRVSCWGWSGHGRLGHGGDVVRADRLMHGKTSPILHQGASVFAGLPSPFEATRYHSLIVKKDTLPDFLEVTAWTAADEIMGLRHKEHPAHGVQFNPQSILTEYGKKMLENFLSF